MRHPLLLLLAAQLLHATRGCQPPKIKATAAPNQRTSKPPTHLCPCFQQCLHRLCMALVHSNVQRRAVILLPGHINVRTVACGAVGSACANSRRTEQQAWRYGRMCCWQVLRLCNLHPTAVHVRELLGARNAELCCCEFFLQCRQSVSPTAGDHIAALYTVTDGCAAVSAPWMIPPPYPPVSMLMASALPLSAATCSAAWPASS